MSQIIECNQKTFPYILEMIYSSTIPGDISVSIEDIETDSFSIVTERLDRSTNDLSAVEIRSYFGDILISHSVRYEGFEIGE